MTVMMITFKENWEIRGSIKVSLFHSWAKTELQWVTFWEYPICNCSSTLVIEWSDTSDASG